MDRDRTQQLFARWAPDHASDPIVRDVRVDGAILDAAAPKSGETALDLSTGSGYFAVEIARRVAPGQVVGIDVSTEMLEIATRAAESANLTNVRFVEAPPGAVPNSLSLVDLVTCCYAIHHFEDPQKTLRRAAEMLRPGGRMVLADLRGTDDPLRSRAMVKLIQSYYDPSFRWSITSDQARALLRRAGLQDVKIGWMPKLSYMGIHIAEVLHEAKGNPESLRKRARGNLSEAELEALQEWANEETHFEPERILGVFIASAVKPSK